MDYIQLANDIGLPTIPRVSYDADQVVEDGTFHTAGLTDSKLGGAPYRPKGAGWPVDSNGRHMCFVAQLNLAQVEHDRIAAGVPPLFDGAMPTSGLLQFFLRFDDTFGLYTEGTKCFVAFLEDFSAEADDPVFCYSPNWKEPVKWAYENRHPAVKRERKELAYSEFESEECILANPDVPCPLIPKVFQPALQRPLPGWHVEVTDEQNQAWPKDAVSEEYTKAYVGQALHQVGGVPNFTQDDPRPGGSNLRLLFQLDGNTHAVQIGDAGTMQFFIDPADLARRDFSKVLMNWACF
ncbi:YwqG family protein [Staphylococcus chromogenes]|nr:YwqG family protein [Staphylococcus chromogenes]